MKIGIVGNGCVGATAAYALVMQGVGSNVVLVDKNTERSTAEANEIRHSVPFAFPPQVRAGSYEDLSGSQVALPRSVNGDGVLETFPLPLCEQESKLLCESARVIRQALSDLEMK